MREGVKFGASPGCLRIDPSISELVSVVVYPVIVAGAQKRVLADER